ncbi:MAG TPA: hypothetical protein VLC08_10395 [Chitinolyticbacter sp.]|nr:hypothetical protein [Chitinolyticbacter sp.]
MSHWTPRSSPAREETMLLSLELPPKDPKLAGFVEIRPRELRTWLAALPNNSPLEAGRQILDAMTSCNRVEVDAEERVKLLDEYQTALELLAAGFETLYHATGFPLKDKARQAAILVRGLWQELATGYKIALIERMEKRFLFGGNKLTPQLIHQILSLYYRLYQVSSQVSMALPDGIWFECHQLFRYAAENRHLDETRGIDEGPTISVLYKRLLLLSLADPMRFAPAELTRVIEAVDNYSRHAHFQPVAAQQPSAAGFFLVRLDVDEPPHYIGSRAVENYQGMAMLLDTVDLGKKLHRALAGLEAKAPMAGDRVKLMLWMETMRRLIKQWSIAPKRVFQRMHTDAQIELAHGLKAAAQSLLTSNGVDVSHRALQTELDALPQITTWRILNESPGGYAVSTRDAPTGRLHAGDIVALRQQGSTGWLVGAIRWLQQCEDGALEMGLQVLAVCAEAAQVRPHVASDAQFDTALVLPAIVALNQPALLAAGKGHYAPLRELILRTPEGERVVRATRLVEQQMSFDLFEYVAD